MQERTLLASIWPTAVAIVIMLIAAVIYFSPQLEGKEIPSSDTLANRGMTQELKEHYEETGERALWTNSMFGGMPAYQIYAPERGNLLRYVEDVLSLGFTRPIGYFFTIMIGLFILLRVLNVGVWLSMIGAITFALSANHLTLFEAGHMTKIRAISFMAPTLAGLILLFRGRYWIGLGTFALFLGLNIFANHPQMTYYLAAACACFVIFRLIHDLGRHQLPRFAKALGLALLAAGLAIFASYSKLSTTIEYGKDTMRGAPILTSATTGDTPTSSSEVEGLEWNYAMQWSNGPIDIMASFIPGIAGGGQPVAIERDGPIGTALRQNGQQLPPNFELPLYHGELPFTSGPAYFGAIAVYLFILAMFWLPAGWRYFFGSAVLLTLLISMGKHAEWLNRPLFNLLPYFNNFRSPSSATSITAMLVAAGGFAGLCQLLRARLVPNPRVNLRTFYIGTGITAVIVLGVAFLGSAFTDMMSAGDARMTQAGIPEAALVDERLAYMRTSALTVVGYIALVAAGIWAYLRGMLSNIVLLVLVGLVSVTDVWTTGRDYIDKSDFQSTRQTAQIFTPRPVDNQILQDKDPNYRVLDLSINTFNDARISYFHKTIGGYHAAKLQRAQDLIDRPIKQGNQAVLNMLNTRYIITGQQGQEQVQRNPGALGNAWFVQSVQTVGDANAEIEALNNIDPRTTAVVHEEFAEQLPATSFSGSGSIELTAYAPDALSYRSSSDGQQLAVFSEMWYGPDKGWVATIDGEPAPLLRVNYALRGLIVPPGEHTIEMRFEPSAFYTGEKISYAASGIILALFAAALYFSFRRSRRDSPADGEIRIEKIGPR